MPGIRSIMGFLRWLERKRDENLAEDIGQPDLPEVTSEGGIKLPKVSGEAG